MKSVIFFHRSVGHNLIRDGNLYELIDKTGRFTFSDYDQNTDTLSGPHDQSKPGFIFPGGDTKPESYTVIFPQTTLEQYQPIQELALQHDVIIIKSCYPNSNITSNAELSVIKQHYQTIADFFVAHPHKMLVILTSPPLRPLMTKPDRAVRARSLATWLATTNFGSNVTVFDFFDHLAAPQNNPQPNVLKKRYRRWLPFDSHPNANASQQIAPELVEFLARSMPK